MGNICRSPSAEGFFRHHLQQAGKSSLAECDSAGTHGYHIGHAPDRRAISATRQYSVDIRGLRARRVGQDDFSRFDLILGMDQQNLDTLESLKPANSPAELALMMDWVPEGEWREVPDPYYGGPEDFRLMCQLLDQATRALVKSLG